MIHLNVIWDGQTFNDVAAITGDQVRYERVARQQKWPMPQSDDLWPITYLVFLAWSAMKRTHLIDSGTTWEDFSERVESVESADQEDPAVDPTQTAPEPVSG